MEPDDFSLDLSIHRLGRGYQLELAYRDPTSQAQLAPVRGPASFDPTELLAVEAIESDYGKTLARQLFAEARLAQFFCQADAAARAKGSCLRVSLCIDRSAQELQALRWELLRHPETGARLTTSETLLLSRFMVSRDSRPVLLRPRAELRALIVISAPAPTKLTRMKLAPIDFEAELEAVKRVLTERADVGVEVLGGPGSPVTLDAVLEALREDVDIVYLVSHGMFGRISKRPALVFQDASGEAEIVEAELLTERIGELRRPPRLVVLASCESAGDGRQLHPDQRTTAQATLAGRLADAGVPAVLAMQGFISMKTVAVMIPTFFTELLRDGRIDRALAVARGKVRARHDAWMPALFTRLIGGRLWDDSVGEDDAPAYVFVAHDARDKAGALRLCEALLDRGVRPWLDMWDLAPGRSWREPMEEALAGAPAVLLCHGPSAWELAEHEVGQALVARIEREPGTVYRVHLPGADAGGSLSLGKLEFDEGIALDEAGWDEGVDELARCVGVEGDRAQWLTREAERAGLSPAKLSPYCGLEAFREQDARWMFGREQEASELLELIRADRTRFLTLIGASGSGKSSLLLAGVCPALRNGVLGDGRDWSIAYLRPGPRPCEALAHALVDLDGVDDADELAREAGQLRAELLANADTLRSIMIRRGPGRVLLIVDQLEELFTEAALGSPGHDEDESREALAFVRNLLGATQDHARLEGRLWITATLRADFVQRGLEVEELARALKAGSYFALPPMGEEQIRAAIERPAARVGYRVEGKLVDKLIAAAAHQAGRLPLLQHVLRELWTRRDEERRVLSYAAYAETGGLEGAIAVAAERALEGLREQLGEEAERATRRLMTRLVNLGDGRSGDTRRRVELGELGEDVATRRVLEDFVSEARVLVAAEVDGVETLEIAHEALLREWTTLVDWLSADREALKLRQELAKDAGQHHGRSEQSDRGDREFLWGRGRVEEAMRVLGASMVELNELEQGFLDESERAVRTRARRIRGGVVTFMVVAVAVIFGVLRQNAKIVAQSDEISTQSAVVEEQNRDLVEKEREQKDSLSEQRGLRAQMLIPKDQESEALLLAVQAVGIYGPDWEREPPAEARAGLEQVLANDAIIVEDSRVFDGHEDKLLALAYSPDGARLASADAEGVAKIWDVASGESLATLTGHEGDIFGLAFSPRGDRLATVSRDQSARIWDASSGEVLAVLDAHEAPVVVLAYSPDGSRLVTGGYDGNARVWDAERGEPLLTLEGHEKVVSAVAFSPDGSRLATASHDGTARIWDGESGSQQTLLVGHTARIRALEYAPDGAALATAGDDKSARIWDPDSGEQLALLDGHDDVIRVLAYSPDGAQLATGSEDNTVRLWSAERGESIAVLEGHQNSIWSLAYSPDGRQLASSGHEYVVRIWDLDTHAQVAALVGHTDAIFPVVYSPDGARLASASFDGTVRVWRAAIDNPMVTHRGHQDYVYDLAFSPDGRRIATASRDASARVWDRVGRQLSTLDGHERGIVTIAYSRDGAHLATASHDKTVRIWDPESGELIRILAEHEHRISGLAYSPDGTQLATASYDKSARIWDPDSGEILLTLDGHEAYLYGLAYSPDGSRLATFSTDCSARIWDTHSGDALATLAGHEKPIWSVVYSPEGSRLATASEDGSARIWSVEGKEQLALLDDHDAPVHAIAYAPAGDQLATASSDGTARVWAADGEPLSTLVGHEGPVYAVTYTPDGSKVVTGGDDGTIRFWDAASGDHLSTSSGHESAVTKLVLSPDRARLGSCSDDFTAKIWDPNSGAPLTELRDRIGLRQVDGLVAWPVPELELTRMGCRRLQPFEEAYARAADICGPLLAAP